jgi:hypothetical protein
MIAVRCVGGSGTETAMKTITKLLAGGVAIVALAAAAPAAAQYFPGMGYPGMGYPGTGYGYPGYGYGYQGYGMGSPINSQAVVSQCTAAVQQRLGGGYAYGYGNAYGGGRVLGVSRVEPHSDGGVTVRGVASSGRFGAYGYGQQQAPDLTWRCRTDFRGFVVDVDINPAQRTYGYNNSYTPYGNSPYDYSQYGYVRY